MRVFGTVLVSTTLIHGVHFMAPKYSAAALISSSVMPFAMAIITFVLALRASALFLRVAPEVGHRLDEIADRQSRDAGVFRPALSVRVVAEAAGAHVRPLAVRDDVGHRRVVAGKPVGRTEPVADLRQRERCGAARNLLE